MDLNGLKEIVKDLTQSAESRAVSKALKCFSKGQMDKAIEILTEAKAASPENTDILFDLSRYLVLASRGSEAAEALRTVLRRNPKIYQRANEMIEELRARHAPVSPLFDAIAEHFIRQDDFKSALEALERMKADEIRAFMPRHRGKWEGLRKSAPDARMARTSLHSAYYLALCHEALREYDLAASIFRIVAKNNPEDLPKIIKRLEALLAKDYQNAALRVAVGDLFLRSGREEEAAQQLGLVLETDPRGGPAVADRLAEYLKEKGEKPELRFILVSAHLAARQSGAALEEMRPLIDSGALLDRVVPVLESLAAADPARAAEARLLLASALARRGQPQPAVDILLAIAEEKGLAAIREPLEAIAAAAPGSAKAHHLLADLHLAEKRGSEAVDCLRKARAAAPQEEGLLVPRLVRILEADPSCPDAHLLLSDLLIRSGERGRAIVVLRHLVREAPASAGEAVARFAAILKENPSSARARIGSAEADLEMKRFPEALQQLREAAASGPELAAEFLRTVALLAEAAPGLHEGVAALLREIEPRTELKHAVRFALGEAHFFGGQVAAAGAAFRELLQAAPERAGEIKAALERFDRDSPEAAEARVLLATLCLDRGDYQGALAELSRGGASPALLDRIIARYEEILRAAPDDLAARAAFVETLAMARRFDRVLSLGAETLKLKDDASTARVSLAMGDALREKGDGDTATKRYFAAYGRDRALGAAVIERLRRLIEAEGSLPLGSLALGKVLASEGLCGEAVDSLRAARASDPKLADTVLSELQRLRDSFPADPQPALEMLVILLDSGDHKRAVQAISPLLDARPDLAPVLAGHLDRILKADPQQPFATFEMARALQHLKLLPRSAATYLAAFRLDASLAPMILKRLHEMIDAAPGCPDPYLAACAIHAARGKFQSAAEKIEQALKNLPGEVERLLPRLEEIQKQNRNSAPVSLMLADACLRAGRYDKALAAFGEAARRDPSLQDRACAGIEAVVKAAPDLGEGYLWRARMHARRMQVDLALADLKEAARLAHHLGPRIIEEAEALRERAPESHATILLLADHYVAAGKDAEATRILQEALARGGSRAERLATLVRLWRVAASGGDEDAARQYLSEAARLSPDRNQFLLRVHDTHLALLRAVLGRLRGQIEHGSRRGAEMQAMLRALLDLGQIQEAAAVLERHAPDLDPREAARLRAEIALHQGDYPRAAEHLMRLGASQALAFAASRAGDFALAARTLETLIKRSGDPGLQVALARVYRQLVAADLMGGRRRLAGETRISFGEGSSA
ncbi:MAG: tetratricopeptide repeat protein [Acidobacteria bacterium]|nr:tetratricopeptide repeat protein [Acidobacteriota bacterium]